MSKRTKELEEQLGILRAQNQVLRQENEQISKALASRRTGKLARVDFLGGIGLRSGYNAYVPLDAQSGDVVTIDTARGRRPARVR